MKRIRVTIDDGIDEDCNLLTKEYDVLNAQRVYSNGQNLHIIPFDSEEEIVIELGRFILDVSGIEV
jgi:hypothetical protein